MDRQTNRQINGQTDEQTDIQKDRHTEKHTDGQTDGQTDENWFKSYNFQCLYLLKGVIRQCGLGQDSYLTPSLLMKKIENVISYLVTSNCPFKNFRQFFLWYE